MLRIYWKLTLLSLEDVPMWEIIWLERVPSLVVLELMCAVESSLLLLSERGRCLHELVDDASRDVLRVALALRFPHHVFQLV